MRYNADTRLWTGNADRQSPRRRNRAVELRFLVPEDRAADILRWSRLTLDPDPHGSGRHADTYCVTTLCFDTPAFDVHRRNGSYGRAKYRIRRYDHAPEVFLERKLRTQDMLVKRRSPVALGTLGALLHGPGRCGLAAHWFSRRVAARRLGPICQISYTRVARQTVAAGVVSRLTVDSNVQAWPVDALRFVDGAGTRLVDGQAVVELKFAAAAPAVFKALVECFALTPDPFSKYRLAMSGLGLVQASEPPQADQEDRV